MSSEDMYQQIILDAYRNPKNKGKLENPNISYRDSNPFCGDIIEVNARVNGDLIKEIKFDGKGCAISQAAVSIMLEDVKGKSLDDVRNIKKEDVLNLLGINISPIRLKCALLGMKVLKMGVYKYLGEKYNGEEYFEE